MPSQRWRPVQFGSVFRENCARFSLYYRYYGFSTATGHDYIFYYNSTRNGHPSLYMHIKAVSRVE